mmetsp:Transcript_13510/g.32076  ORF Transcript_13510/g.32076 Transcript_13510/m.32076 type:complete len:95 (+) Transcript_13510:87-371(+)|eukprot:CAMPEP_0181453304 /NCGR_PEP_ID=MMETSP1110-20121109/29656_1 /TAXON_ID=174948 /ORGANISM="Symbiodinium sp., Strain CCMP421" /LENGTH=94 /DNA_ID=CAMNT_0023577619 /DNA_START=84 /DNA_END=368 /DNA_ORIENTATION=-
MGENSPEANSLPLPRLAKQDMHRAGLCVPCLFFTQKADGCRKGDTCSHCHLCDASEAAARRKQLKKATKKLLKKGAEEEEANGESAEVKKVFWL